MGELGGYGDARVVVWEHTAVPQELLFAGWAEWCRGFFCPVRGRHWWSRLEVVWWESVPGGFFRLACGPATLHLCPIYFLSPRLTAPEFPRMNLRILICGLELLDLQGSKKIQQ